MHVAADEVSKQSDSVVMCVLQGCAKEVNIIRSIRPTSVQDFDKQG